MSTLSRKLSLQWKDVICLGLGLWMIVSPWTLAYADAMNPTWNAWIMGALITAAAFAALSAFHKSEEWFSVIFGLWLVIAPWALEFSSMPVATWNHIVVGACVVVLSLWTVITASDTPGLMT
ncbi:SPW repeat protein [Rhizobiales bacterium]|uniref:SPW repeat protein n=1 Tax=Hongsoonwoonella zoysiae TaxID=2821844 RepID=UPI00155F54B6|nr:SPW repeat protein [Hongsoonwoonella zoysiae]NRG19011.1 SPW repeat protein [Hongsoonwoonella zoysiae]